MAPTPCMPNRLDSISLLGALCLGVQVTHRQGGSPWGQHGRSPEDVSPLRLSLPRGWWAMAMPKGGAPGYGRDNRSRV